MKNISKYHRYRTMSGIGFAATLISACATIEPPTEQMAVAKVAVSNANNAGGNEFAPAEMRTAQDKLERATQAMTTKDYKNAQVLAEQAEADAQLALAKARSAKAQKAALTIQEDSRVLRQELDRKNQQNPQ